MNRLRLALALFAVLSVPFLSLAEEKQDGGWSADLLMQILRSDTPKPPLPGSPGPSPEMVLHTYHLTNLRIGEAGKAQNMVTILLKLLPPSSSLNSDIPANSLHVLTTPAAHKAVWDYLCAIDVPEPATAAPAAIVPEEVKVALKKLADTGEQSSRVLAAVDALKTDVSNEFANIDARQRRQTFKLAGIGIGFAVVLLVLVGWMLRRRSAAATAATSSALAVVPDQLASALTPVHDKMRNDMLGLLNEVAIKLQAQHNEQQKLVREQQLQLEDARHALAAERKQFITEAGSMVVRAVERVDATTAKLAKQQDKVAELVQELQSTVRELDETKDSLRTKEVQLEQERAKIAALSILLEEGGGVPPAAFGTNGHHVNGHSNGSSVPSNDHASNRNLSPCTNPDRATSPENPPPPPPRFTFLPPDQPET